MIIERPYYESHPIAEIFPILSNAELNVLADDIKENGLQNPILLYEGKILDGRNRMQACLIGDVEPTFVEYTGDNPLQYVVSTNLHRRHLNESQRAMAAAKIANMQRGNHSKPPIGGFNASQAEAAAKIVDNQSEDQPYPPIGGFNTSQAEAAAMFNVSERSIQRAAKVKQHAVPEVIEAVETGKVPVSVAADLSEAPSEIQKEVIAKDDKKAVLAASKEIRQELAAQRHNRRTAAINEAIANNQPLDGSLGTFAVIYADPPWKQDFNKSDTGTMTLDEIVNLDVPGISHEDAVLFLWATSSKLKEAFQILNAWDFTYRTCAVWDKQKTVSGSFFREQHELLLVATKGKLPDPLPGVCPPSIIRFPKGEHSSKPEVIYLMIEEMYPDLPKIELFCHSPREGWTAWGTDITNLMTDTE